MVVVGRLVGTFDPARVMVAIPGDEYERKRNTIASSRTAAADMGLGRARKPGGYRD
jgi:hypothetical protein